MQIRALKLDVVNIYYDKARCHARMGAVIKAVVCLSRAIALDPKYRDMAKTDGDFDAIRADERFREVVGYSGSDSKTGEADD